MKPRLVFLLPGTDTGGMELFLLRLLPQCSAVAEVSVIVRSDRRGALDEEYEATGCPVYYQPVGYLDPVGKWRLFGLFRRLRPDAVCDLSGIFSGVPLTIAFMAGVSHRVGFHRRSTFAFRQTLGRRLYARVSIWLLNGMASKILANSQTALNFFHPRLVRQQDSRLAVIRNMIDPAELEPRRSYEEVRAEIGIPGESRVVLHVGRLDPAKDHETLLGAMLRLMQQWPDVHCVLAGPRTEVLNRNPIVATAPEIARFHFLGDRRDVPDLLAIADLFLFPSVTEGMPNALVEAMLVGLPVVASDIEPIRELIPPQGHKVLVPAGDVDGFVQAANSCLRDAEQRTQRIYKNEIQAMTNPGHVLPELLSQLFPSRFQEDKSGWI